MSYLIAVPGIRQKIDEKIYTIKRMYSSRKDAANCVYQYRDGGNYHDARLYVRMKNGKLFGKHPYCVAVRGRKQGSNR